MTIGQALTMATPLLVLILTQVVKLIPFIPLNNSTNAGLRLFAALLSTVLIFVGAYLSGPDAFAALDYKFLATELWNAFLAFLATTGLYHVTLGLPSLKSANTQ